MIEIVLDTETTGLSVKDGHRIVEIGCIELKNQIPTKRFFHCLLNPERKVLRMHLKFMVIQMNSYQIKKNFQKLLRFFRIYK